MNRQKPEKAPGEALEVREKPKNAQKWSEKGSEMVREKHKKGSERSGRLLQKAQILLLRAQISLSGRYLPFVPPVPWGWAVGRGRGEEGMR